MLGHKFSTFAFGHEKFMLDNTGKYWLNLIQGDLATEGRNIDEHTDFIKPIFLPIGVNTHRLEMVQKFDYLPHTGPVNSIKYINKNLDNPFAYYKDSRVQIEGSEN